jgi:hypothetical protein
VRAIASSVALFLAGKIDAIAANVMNRDDGVPGPFARCHHRQVGGDDVDVLDIASGPLCILVSRKGAAAAVKTLPRDSSVGSCAFAVANNV